MKKKIANIIEGILQIILIIMPFFMGCTVEIVYFNSALPDVSKPGILSDVIIESPFFNIMFYTLMAINILMCGYSAISKSKKVDSKLHCALPIIIFIFTNITFIGITDINSIENLLVYEVLMFAVIVISFVKRASFIVGEDEKNVNENVKKTDVDKIKEFKELLDSGVITQEEFDEKKKQLLNL